ncbi:MAG TPA: winged helix-turn-helix domain-containing protein [Tahibacter sp.]|uniref:winged helix-turn-helix domain-containing protein n=1 Tax=Tahibacter sp. TaxID=2056211 RepID=UPI002C94D3D0|nr:winged helix-turn-helix domain-containing protein [Tahibacter sp.]HSX62334.1 winged helix-turn-helix domain-containing protein [Tahibacter sp.]
MRPEVFADTSLRRILCLAGRRVDVGALRVLGDGDAQRLTPKAVGVLLELARDPGVTRTRDELLARVWAGRAGDGDVLTQAVKELRRVFGDDLSSPRFIETVPRLGYRLLAAVEWEEPAAQAALTDPSPVDDIAVMSAAAPANASRTLRRRWFAAVALLLAAAFAAFALRTADAPPPASVAGAPLLLTAEPGAETTPRLSPDGSRLAYVAIDADSRRQRVHVRGVNASTTLFPSEGRGEESWPVWSGDGAQIAFVRREAQRCDLVTVDALGGVERARSRCARGLFESFDWSPDGSRFAIARFDGPGTARLSLIAVEGGEPLPFDYSHDPTEHDLAPHFSPDGATIAFRRGLSPYGDLYLVATNGGDARRLTRLSALIRGFDWLPDGSGIVFASNHGGTEALYRVDIADGRVSALGVAPAQMPDVARHGDALAYEVPRTRSVMQGVVLGDDAAAGGEIAPSTGSDSYAVLSPDGSRLAFVSDRGGSPQLWLHDAGARQSYALTHNDGALFLYPQWSADGRRIVVTRRRDGRGELVEIDLDSQAQRAVSDAATDVRFGTYAPGSGFLVVDRGGRSPRLLRIASAQAAAQPLRDNVAAVDVDPRSGRIYYSRADGAGVRELRDAGDEDAVIAAVSNRFAWHVRNGALWYFAANGDDADELLLRRRGLDDGSDATVWRTREAVDHRSFDVSGDARRLVLVRITRNDTDIALLRFLRDRR